MNAYRRATTDFFFARPLFTSGMDPSGGFWLHVRPIRYEADVRASVSDWLSVGDDIKGAVDAGLDDDECAA